MAFKDNLRKKIEIDRLARQVAVSIGPPGSGHKVDKGATRELLEMSGYAHRRDRDLDLYVQEDKTGKDRVVVLDNELAMYLTSPQDVAMRKSPTVKEMISIRNAIKILKDSDVVLGRREATVEMLHDACIKMLDLHYDTADIEEMVSDGRASVDNGYSDGVLETLSLFAELLGMLPPPGVLKIPHCHIAGIPGGSASQGKTYGPLVIYDMMHNTLRFVDDAVGIHDSARIEQLHRMAKGEQPPDQEGADVFDALGRRVIEMGAEGGSIYRMKQDG